METSTKYNRYGARIPKGMGEGRGVVGSLSFDVQGREWGSQFGSIRTDRTGGGGMQKLDIFHGCHKCMVPYKFILILKLEMWKWRSLRVLATLKTQHIKCQCFPHIETSQLIFTAN